MLACLYCSFLFIIFSLFLRTIPEKFIQYLILFVFEDKANFFFAYFSPNNAIRIPVFIFLLHQPERRVYAFHVNQIDSRRTILQTQFIFYLTTMTSHAKLVNTLTVELKTKASIYHLV